MRRIFCLYQRGSFVRATRPYIYIFPNLQLPCAAHLVVSLFGFNTSVLIIVRMTEALKYKYKSTIESHAWCFRWHYDTHSTKMKFTSPQKCSRNARVLWYQPQLKPKPPKTLTMKTFSMNRVFFWQYNEDLIKLKLPMNPEGNICLEQKMFWGGGTSHAVETKFISETLCLIKPLIISNPALQSLSARCKAFAFENESVDALPLLF